MQVEGIPDGWELVKVGKVKPGEIRVDSEGNPAEWNSVESTSVNYVVIRKKDKQYRPFANAAEYMPNWGKPVCYKNKASSFSLSSANFAGNLSVYIAFGDTIRKMKYQEAFDMLVFADGTPFGVEVTK